MSTQEPLPDGDNDSLGTTEEVSLKYVGHCEEGNCDFTIDCPDEDTAQRTAGRHEGANDFQHQVTLEVVVDA